MAQGIPLSSLRSISLHLPVKISSFFTFLQASQTQISSAVLPDIWYLYLIISFKSRRLFEDFPITALGRADPAESAFFPQLRDLLFHCSWTQPESASHLTCG
jgi:hypothetical protein